jgi:uncharacterized protein (DUF58 family)
MGYASRLLGAEDVERLSQLQLSARRVVEGTTTGLHKSPLKGSSIEFRQHRFYVPGDEPRRLDWRVLGRTDRPYIKEYDEETNLRCAIVLDRSGSMGFASGTMGKFEYASRIVASLAYLMLSNTEAVGLGLFHDRLESWVSPRAGQGQLGRVIETLERSAAAGSSDPARAMHEVAERLGRRSLVIMMSDLFSPVAAVRRGLARLAHDGHELIVLRVLDSAEVRFPFRSWSRFRGLEGESPLLCDSALVRRVYLKNFRQHEDELVAATRDHGAQYATFVTDKPVVDAIARFLRTRTKNASA